MKIRLIDLPRQNALLKKSLMQVFEREIASGKFILSERLEKFEKTFAEFCGKKYAIGLNSGTDALRLALLAYGVGPGDEVITAANSYFSTAMVISDIGATPVLVDIDPATSTIDVSKVEKSMTTKTKAIIPVHLYGQPADMDPILMLARRYNLIIIEDACQAHGSEYKGTRVPVSETGAFSFYPGKNLGAFGDGGALVTDNKHVAEKLLFLRNDGAKMKYYHDMIGMKSRLDSLQAAVLLVKLPYLKSWNKKRRVIAKLYNSLLGDIPGIQIPQEAKGGYHVYHLYVIECDRRNALQLYLKRRGIETVIHYPVPIHLQKAFRNKDYKRGAFPVTEYKAKKILSLPMFPEMTEREILFVAKTVKRFMERSV